MATIAVAITVGAMTAACSNDPPSRIVAAIDSPPGQLFCSIQLAGGGTLVAGVVDAVATAAAPGAAPLAILATGQTKAFVDEVCARAAQQVAGGVAGMPVPPPGLQPAVQQVQVAPPPNQVTAPVPMAAVMPRA
jgi:hypothetical protein